MGLESGFGARLVETEMGLADHYGVSVGQTYHLLEYWCMPHSRLRCASLAGRNQYDEPYENATILVCGNAAMA
jgi:hypothetical protein